MPMGRQPLGQSGSCEWKTRHNLQLDDAASIWVVMLYKPYTALCAPQTNFLTYRRRFAHLEATVSLPSV